MREWIRRAKVRKLVGWHKDSLISKAKAVHTSKAKQGIHSLSWPKPAQRWLTSSDERGWCCGSRGNSLHKTVKQLCGETIAAISEGYHASGGFPWLSENSPALNVPRLLPAAGKETCTARWWPTDPQDSEDWTFHLKPNKAGETPLQNLLHLP